MSCQDFDGNQLKSLTLNVDIISLSNFSCKLFLLLLFTNMYLCIVLCINSDGFFETAFTFLSRLLSRRPLVFNRAFTGSSDRDFKVRDCMFRCNYFR